MLWIFLMALEVFMFGLVWFGALWSVYAIRGLIRPGSVYELGLSV